MLKILSQLEPIDLVNISQRSIYSQHLICYHETHLTRISEVGGLN